MSDFELLRDITIGQYIPTGSVVHRLDPRAKILAAVFLTLAISFARTTLSAVVMLIITLAIARASRIPFSYMFRGILLGLPVLIFIFIMQFLFQGWTEPAGLEYFQYGWLRVTRYSMQLIALGIVRIIGFIFVTSLITMTSSTTELTHGSELLMRPFRRFGLPSHELAVMMMITLRFVPTLAEELERIMKAQASRCGDINTGGFWRPDKAARAMLPLIVPLFMNAFRRAEELVWAMEARCYVSGAARTKFVEFKARTRDWVVVGASVVVFLLMLLIPWPPVRLLLAPLGLNL